jgi:hypothetical protein
LISSISGCVVASDGDGEGTLNDGSKVSSAGPDAAARQKPGRPLDPEVIKNFLIYIQSERSAEDFNQADRPGRNTLFHYTDLGGLIGILSNDDLWLTNCRFSNDEGEMSLGYAIAKGVIEDELRTAPAENKDFLQDLHDLLDANSPDDVYICCFCDEDNLLSQWRGYGANGTGVSIEIDAKKFSWATGPDMPLGVMRLWQVDYDQEKQKGMVRHAIQFGLAAPGDVKERAQMAADAIKFFIPTFKDRDFREEREWRLIFTPGPNCTVGPQFRVGRQMLVPYYSFRGLLQSASAMLPGAPADELKKLPIRHVLVGPSPRGALNKESVRMLLATRDYGEIAVDISKTSYRGS